MARTLRSELAANHAQSAHAAQNIAAQLHAQRAPRGWPTGTQAWAAPVQPAARPLYALGRPVVRRTMYVQGARVGYWLALGAALAALVL